MRSQLPSWVTNPALDPLWTRARDRLERNGLVVTGTVQVEVAERGQRHAMSGLLGRSVTRDRVRVDLGGLDARLSERSGLGGLQEVLTALFGTPPRDRRAEREASAAAREEPLRMALELVDQPWTGRWVEDLRRTGTLTRAPNPEATVRAAAAILDAVLARRGPAIEPAQSRVELAGRVLGDAHSLDEDRLLHRVVLRALAAAAGVPLPETSAERWALWESFGVSPDTVSSTCLTLGLSQLAEPGEPFHLTRWQLRRDEWLHVPSGPVLVCENPRVLEAIAETRAGCIPVVCTAGEPNLVVTSVLNRLAEERLPLRYHGDFDWSGIAIANRLVARFGVDPWLMSAADYENSVRSDAPELTGPPVEPTWDLELGATMRARGRSLHEETVLSLLLAEIPTPGEGR